MTCKTCSSNKARVNWAAGPWDGEPNRVEFRHAGLPCILHRGPGGSWCGYVGLPLGHPFHGKRPGDDDYALDAAVEVHGGMTYAEKCAGCICHIPEPGEPDHLWWLGFDCAHFGDLSPVFDAREFDACDEHYWTLDEVQAETRQFAEQLARIQERCDAP